MHWAVAEEISRADRDSAQRLSVRSAHHTELAYLGGGITIRRSGPGDGHAIAQLAALDGHEWLGGPALLAEVDGSLRAAVPLDGSESFADPFFDTADVTALLEVRAEQLGRRPQRRHRFLPRWAAA